MCPGQLQSGDCADRISDDDGAVVENLLEFRGGLDTATRL
jgi:hypothetical protein